MNGGIPSLAYDGLSREALEGGNKDIKDAKLRG